MGMYFRVEKQDGDRCPYCHAEIDEWQSKHDVEDRHDVWGGCCEKHPDALPTLRKDEVLNFYAICTKCNNFIEYKRTEDGFGFNLEKNLIE